MNRLIKIWYRLVNYWDSFTWLLRWPRRWYQRARYGVSDEDTWSYCTYVSKVNSYALKWLKKRKHGIPMEVFHKNEDPENDVHFKKAEKRWNAKLDVMIAAFDIIKEHRNMFESDKEEKLVKKGLHLFAKHYLSLWD